MQSSKHKFLKPLVSGMLTLALVLTCFSSNLMTVGAASYRDKINDRETFMKGIDYSYYYEEE